jgi:hypothetical protein
MDPFEEHFTPDGIKLLRHGGGYPDGTKKASIKIGAFFCTNKAAHHKVRRLKITQRTSPAAA